MAFQKLDLCLQRTTSSGTGDLDLDVTVTGYQTFAAEFTARGLPSGETVAYKIETADGGWEYGRATVDTSGSPAVLERSAATQVRSSEASDAKLDLPAGGEATVFAAVREADLLALDDLAGNGGVILTNDRDGTVTVDTAGAGAGPIWELYRAISGAASNVIGQLLLTGRSATGVKRSLAAVDAVITDATNAAEAAYLRFRAAAGGALVEALRITGAGIHTPDQSPQGANSLNVGSLYIGGVQVQAGSKSIAYDMTATGAIAQGDGVYLRDDGTVSAMFGHALNVVATDAQSSSSGVAIAYISAEDVHVIVYEDDESGNEDLVAIAGSLDSFGAGSYGAKVDVSTSGNTFRYCLAADGPNSRAAVIYGIAGGELWIRILTFSGDAITVGSATHIESGDSKTSPTLPRYLAFGGGAWVAVFYNTTDSELQAVAFTASGTTISVGATVSIGASASSVFTVVYDSGNDTFVVIWDDGSDGDINARPLTVSGNTITLGNLLDGFAPDSGFAIAACYDSTAGAIACFVRDDAVSTTINAYVLTVSGSDVTASSEVEITGAGAPSRADYSPDADRIVLTYGFENVVECEISGGVIANVTDLLSTDATDDDMESCYDSGLDALLMAWRDGANIEMRGWRPGAGVKATGHDSRAEYFGFAQAAISDAASGSIGTRGSIDENQSGLTPGAIYYWQDDGTLGTTETAHRAGRALSATAIKTAGEPA